MLHKINREIFGEKPQNGKILYNVSLFDENKETNNVDNLTVGVIMGSKSDLPIMQ
jgi:hypothetical protein